MVQIAAWLIVANAVLTGCFLVLVVLFGWVFNRKPRPAPEPFRWRRQWEKDKPRPAPEPFRWRRQWEKDKPRLKQLLIFTLCLIGFPIVGLLCMYVRSLWHVLVQQH